MISKIFHCWPFNTKPCPHLDSVKSTRLDQGEGRPCDAETRQTIIRISSGGGHIEKNQKTRKNNRAHPNQNGETNALQLPKLLLLLRVSCSSASSKALIEKPFEWMDRITFSKVFPSSWHRCHTWLPKGAISHGEAEHRAPWDRNFLN